jgi:hypothetical protein
MSDLFTRLAQRAIGGAAASMRAELDPDEVFGAAEDVEHEAVADAGSGEPPRTAPGVAPVVPGDTAAPVVSERAAKRAPQPPATPLTPVPSIVPPSIIRERVPALADISEPSLPPPPGVRSQPVAARASLHRPGEPAAPPRAAPEPLRPVPGALHPPLPQPAAPPRREPPAPPPVGPSVEVTIGRVEVRVRPPGAPEPGRREPSPAPLPALSLDDYLRGRESSS